MSAAVLRKAATAIREEWGDSGPRPMGTAWHQERDFHLAAAAWLDNFAEHGDAGDYGPDEWDAALAVARAYLGEPA